MKILAFSDIHRDLEAVRELAARCDGVDLLVGAGDYATMRQGLQPVVDAIAAIGVTTILTHGNGESHGELKAACSPYDHVSAHHAETVEVLGTTFFLLGAAVPVTPFGDWSVDLSEEQAAECLASCPDEAVLVCHAPPIGHCDVDGHGTSRGSSAIRDAVLRTRARLLLCGHIHHSWGERSSLGSCTVVNVGPTGVVLEV